MRALLAMALLLVPTPALAAAAEADDCALLQRIAAAAAEPTPFASLAGADLSPLLGSWCRVDTPAPRVLMCSRSLAPAEFSAEATVARIRRCLPGTESVTRRPWEAIRLRHGRLVIDVDQLGGPRAKVGRIVTLYLASAEPERGDTEGSPAFHRRRNSGRTAGPPPPVIPAELSGVERPRHTTAAPGERRPDQWISGRKRRRRATPAARTLDEIPASGVPIKVLL